MKKSDRKIDILNGSLEKNILLFAIPIALSGMLQQLFNAADTAVVGRFENSQALAAVGTNAETVALAVALSSGLASGANVVIARCAGKKKNNAIPGVVMISLIIAVIAGLVGAAAGVIMSEPLLNIIKTPENIMCEAVRYLRIYMGGYIFLMVYDFGSAVLRAIGDSRYPFIVLMICGGVNVVLNIIFVSVFKMGVAGVAAATDISNALAAAAVLIKIHKSGLLQFKIEKADSLGKFAGEILKTGIPAAVQGAVFCVANIFVQAAVNSLGSEAIAGSTIAMNYEYFVYYMITAFAQTATTFVSQNHAAGNTLRCRKIIRVCLVFSTLMSAAMIAPIVIFSDFFARIFSDDSAVIECAGVRIMHILLFESMCCLFEIPAGAMRAEGHPVLPAVCTVSGTCALRIVWIFTVFRVYASQSMLYSVFPLSWVVTIVLVWGCRGFVRRRKKRGA